MNVASRDSLPPRGALAVIAVGLLACIAAALLTTEEPLGATELNWESRLRLPGSKPTAIPGGGEVRIINPTIRATSSNGGGYKLYRVSGALTLLREQAPGARRASCRVRVPSGALLTHTGNKVAAYPLPSEELLAQPVPARSEIQFIVGGASTATVSLDDAFRRFANRRGVGVSWGPRGPTTQQWRWTLPPSHAASITLAFASIWRTDARAGAQISCTLGTDAGIANLATTTPFPG